MARSVWQPLLMAVLWWVACLGGTSAPCRGGEFEPTAQQRLWWSLQPLSIVEPPRVSTAGWDQVPLDRFILSQLEQHGLQAAAPANRATWIRRAKFAVVGLPPTVEEVHDFVNDRSPDAADVLLDRWLASPRFGEHWARHWLDVVRYTDYLSPHPDGGGEEGGVEFYEAFRYRDWVVDAFNQDLPFDDFVVHQIAGDRLASPRGEPIYPEGLIATTLLAIGVWDNGDADKEKILSKGACGSSNSTTPDAATAAIPGIITPAFRRACPTAAEVSTGRSPDC